MTLQQAALIKGVAEQAIYDAIAKATVIGDSLGACEMDDATVVSGRVHATAKIPAGVFRISDMIRAAGEIAQEVGLREADAKMPGRLRVDQYTVFEDANCSISNVRGEPHFVFTVKVSAEYARE